MRRLGQRIQVLEQRQPVGCPACRPWHGVVIEDSFGERSRPDRCPACGREEPARAVIFLEGIPWDCV
jgi:hypothetical protein